MALAIVEPAIGTGSMRATGVTRPVRPIWIWIERTTLTPSGASNVTAIAQRG